MVQEGEDFEIQKAGKKKSGLTKMASNWTSINLFRELLGAPSNIAGAPSNFYEWAILPFNKKL